MTQVPALARVGIQSADRDTRIGQAETLFEVLVHDAEYPVEQGTRDPVRNGAQGQVGGRECDTQGAGHQHHDRQRRGQAKQQDKRETRQHQ